MHCISGLAGKRTPVDGKRPGMLINVFGQLCAVFSLLWSKKENTSANHPPESLLAEISALLLMEAPLPPMEGRSRFVRISSRKVSVFTGRFHGC